MAPAESNTAKVSPCFKVRGGLESGWVMVAASPGMGPDPFRIRRRRGEAQIFEGPRPGASPERGPWEPTEPWAGLEPVGPGRGSRYSFPGPCVTGMVLVV
ncbi:hypothetical protein ROR02_30730 [Pararhodospirillum oryzae]|uniref:Uncharacterized protein n=1 Tax=Pararhodospirillum oryzae TaxID=478448 RepID=A0A512HBW9_9PROT|nr:hypothetical protein ROR02_30730 [Pararhodospirillum oryzae]